jgi:hypothetical protein
MNHPPALNPKRTPPDATRPFLAMVDATLDATPPTGVRPRIAMVAATSTNVGRKERKGRKFPLPATRVNTSMTLTHSKLQLKPSLGG